MANNKNDFCTENINKKQIDYRNIVVNSDMSTDFLNNKNLTEETFFYLGKIEIPLFVVHPKKQNIIVQFLRQIFGLK